MQKVGGGELRGRNLLSLPPKLRGVRPTSSMVRSAIFDRLQDRIVGARVLDLFAGSGAVTVEALSRGAGFATAVEKNPGVYRFLQRQITALGLESRSELWRGDARRYLSRNSPETELYSLVFCDPPYAEYNLYDEVLSALKPGLWLAPEADIVVERSRRAPPFSKLGSHLQVLQQKVYGDSELLFLRACAA